MEVEKGMVKGDVHDCLFPKGVSPNGLLAGADIGAGKEVYNIAQLTAPHSFIEGWFPYTRGNTCV